MTQSFLNREALVSLTSSGSAIACLSSIFLCISSHKYSNRKNPEGELYYIMGVLTSFIVVMTMVFKSLGASYDKTD